MTHHVDLCPGNEALLKQYQQFLKVLFLGRSWKGGHGGVGVISQLSLKRKGKD